MVNEFQSCSVQVSTDYKEEIPPMIKYWSIFEVLRLYRYYPMMYYNNLQNIIACLCNAKVKKEL